MDIYNDYHFLNAVCLGDWYGFVWGDYDKVLPFYQKKKFGLIPYVCMPPFCQKFDNRPLSEEEWHEVQTILKQQNFIVDYAAAEAKSLENSIGKNNFVLKKDADLALNPHLNYSGLLRRNLDKAKKHLKVVEEISDVEFQKLIQSMPKFQDLVLKKYAPNFYNLRKTHLKTLYAVDSQNSKAVAMILYVQFGDKAYLLFPYTTQLGKDYQAMSLLINHLVESNMIRVLDFEGSSIESIAKFYRQFGAEEQEYWTFRWRFFNI